MVAGPSLLWVVCCVKQVDGSFEAVEDFLGDLNKTEGFSKVLWCYRPWNWQQKHAKVSENRPFAPKRKLVQYSNHQFPEALLVSGRITFWIKKRKLGSDSRWFSFSIINDFLGSKLLMWCKPTMRQLPAHTSHLLNLRGTRPQVPESRCWQRFLITWDTMRQESVLNHQASGNMLFCMCW